MLEEHEWEIVAPLLSRSLEEIQLYRAATGASVSEARAKGCGADALAAYLALTGYAEKDVSVLWHHVLSQYGPCCAACGKPYRTPNAQRCVELGCPP